MELLSAISGGILTNTSMMEVIMVSTVALTTAVCWKGKGFSAELWTVPWNTVVASPRDLKQAKLF